MIGLLKKDLLVIKRNFKPMQLLIILVCIIPLTQNPQFALPIFGSIVVFFFSTTAISIFSYDESARWDRYEPALPFKRKKLVGEKYILSIIFILSSTFISLLVSFLMTVYASIPIYQMLNATLISFLISLVYFSIMLPAIYKFGIELGRNILYVIILLPVSIITIIGMFKIKIDLGFIYNNYIFFKQVLLVLTILIFYLSYKLSVKIYEKKQF